MVVEVKTAGVNGEAHLEGHNTLANTLALQDHFHSHLGEAVKLPMFLNFLLVDIVAAHLGNSNQALPFAESQDRSTTHYPQKAYLPMLKLDEDNETAQNIKTFSNSNNTKNQVRLPHHITQNHPTHLPE